MTTIGAAHPADRAERIASGGWTRAERTRLAVMLGAIAALHVTGISFHLVTRGDVAAASGVAGAGVLAYVLGVRHAFDADHIAAIDDTTRVMLLRGRRPVGVGFFFAMGHSTVVVVLALLVATAAGHLSEARVESLRSVGGATAAVVAMLFLLLVAFLNARVLTTLVTLWRRLRRGEETGADVEAALLSRGLLNRVAGGRIRSLIQHSWHMYPVGLLMGLGLETASEVTLLALSASTAAGGHLPLLAILSLPLLFAAGMSMFDTADSLVMTRLYSWSYREPVRTLFFNIATTTVTVAVAGFVALVYLAGVLVDYGGVRTLEPFAMVGDHFEVMGYVIAGIFTLTWVGAAVSWRWLQRAR